MEKRSTSGTGIINALLLAVISLLAVAAITLPSARAAELSAADVCDREAGSIFDLQRNQAFPAVATEDIRIGVALSACREAYNQKSGARAEFQLARVLDKAGQKAQSLRILGEAAEHGHALAMTNYAVLLGEQGDMDRMVQGFKLMRSILSQPALAGLGGRELESSARARSDAEIEQFIRAYTDTIYHPVGTCRMGPGAMDVVDAQLRVHGIESLRVVDASIMPRIVGGNTNAPTVMIGEKAADMIKAAAAGSAPPVTQFTPAAETIAA